MRELIHINSTPSPPQRHRRSFPLFPHGPNDASQEVFLEIRIGIVLLLVAERGEPAPSTLELVTPRQRAGGLVFRLGRIVQGGQVAHQQDVEARGHGLEIIKLIFPTPGFPQKGGGWMRSIDDLNRKRLQPRMPIERAPQHRPVPRPVPHGPARGVDADKTAPGANEPLERRPLVLVLEAFVIRVRENQHPIPLQVRVGKRGRVVRYVHREAVLFAELSEGRHAAGDVVVNISRLAVQPQTVARIHQDAARRILGGRVLAGSGRGRRDQGFRRAGARHQSQPQHENGREIPSHHRWVIGRQGTMGNSCPEEAVWEALNGVQRHHAGALAEPPPREDTAGMLRDALVFIAKYLLPNTESADTL